MSDTDPYAAPVVEEAKSLPEAAPESVETPEVASQTAPVASVEAVPEGSIKRVLDWVGDDVTRAQAALDAENDGEKRVTLINKLETIVN